MDRQILLLTIVLLMTGGTVDGKPSLHRSRQRSAYGSFGGFDGGALSASSYDSLGIQPSHHRSSRNNQKAYWWQGPESPFSEGAAQSHGVSSGSPKGPSRPQTVIGCSGDGCSSPLFQAPVTSASVASPPSSASWGSSSGSFNSGGGSGGGCSGGCQYFWQKPGHPCSNHAGPGCPNGFSCVHYEWCSNGIVLRGGSGSSSSPGRKPSRHELMSHGKPCGDGTSQVCCMVEQRPAERPQTQPVISSPSYPSPSYPSPSYPSPSYPSPSYPSPSYPSAAPAFPAFTYPPPETTPRPTTQRPVTQPVIVPDTSYLPPTQKPVTQPVVAPDTSYLPPILPPVQPPVKQPVVENLVQQTTSVYYPPSPPVVVTTQRPRPVVTSTTPRRPIPPTEPVVAAAPQGPPGNEIPYPGCAAALKCVSEEFCSIEGIMVNTPVFLTEQQKIFRVPLMSCFNTETGQTGYCCRDPLYQDPWPGGMPMPAAPAPPPPPPVAPVVQEPVFVGCSPDEMCLNAQVCSMKLGTFNSQSGPCQTFNGQGGVCCRIPVPAAPTQEYLPPPPVTTTTTTTTPRPTQPVVAQPPPPPPPIDYLPPVPATTTTRRPPVTQPVVVPSQELTPPTQEYLPPVSPPQQPVTSYVPPAVQPTPNRPAPPPVPAAQVAGDQCGVSRPMAQPVASGEAALGEFPWHAMIAQQNGSMSCSGALIGPKFVATAFHCVRGVPPSSLRVRLGEQRVGASNEPLPHYEIPVAAVIGHPQFVDGSLFNDVAVLMLAVAAPAGQDHIAPICLPASSEPLLTQCVVTGWGHDTLSGLQEGALNKVRVDLVRNTDCQSSLQNTHLGKYFKLHQSFTCASTLNSINPCKVDGGSPLACKRPDGGHVLAGLSSWSVGCSNQHQPGVYVDVPPVAQWMQEQMVQPEPVLVEQSNSEFQSQQQFQGEFGASAGYGR